MNGYTVLFFINLFGKTPSPGVYDREETYVFPTKTEACEFYTRRIGELETYGYVVNAVIRAVDNIWGVNLADAGVNLLTETNGLTR